MEYAMAKHAKFKIPKRVAGVKIPKVIRKGPLGNFLNSNGGQLILAETVVAMAAAFTAVKTDEDSTVGESLRHPMDGARRLGSAVIAAGSDEGDRLAHAFREAARAFRAALQQRDVPSWSVPSQNLASQNLASQNLGSQKKTGKASDDEVDLAPAKKKSSSRAHSGTQH
jgi:hypothetical protein